jgi:hypothetical protein
MFKCPSWQAIYKGDAPLYIACQEGYLDIVLKLLDKNINTDVNKCTDGDVQAIYKGDTPLLVHLFISALYSNNISTISV